MSDTCKEEHDPGMGLAEMLKGFSDYEEPSDYRAIDDAAYPYSNITEDERVELLRWHVWYRRAWRWMGRLCRRLR